MTQPVVCPLCNKRISDWMMAAGKCVIIKNQMMHSACVQTVKSAEIKFNPQKEP